MLFDGQTVKLEWPGERQEEGIAELRFERGAEPVNKLDALTFSELRRALEIIAATPAIKGVLIASAKDAFIVGADIFEFTAIFKRPPEDIVAFVAQNSEIITALADLPVPTVAAINGLALGGGLELALAADFRVMSSAARIGFPEVHLGLFPGYGGTVRLPRLIGLVASAEWIASGAQQKPEAALEEGAVDAVVAPEDLRAAALATLERAIEAPGEWSQRRRDLRKSLRIAPEEASRLLDSAKAAAAKTLPHLPAAHIALELLEAASDLDRDSALTLEAQAFAKAAKTQAAASLVTIFINEQALKKISRGYAKKAAPVRKAAVVGAGVMGGGIAYQSAARGVPIIMKDIAEQALDLGMSEARKLLARQVEQGRLDQAKADAILGAIAPGLTYEGFDGVDVVIEAVVENIAVKKAVLSELERVTGEAAILASNTSSLRIGDLTEGLRRPDKFIGMHFFNPVPRMALVEVVRGPKTSEETIATIVGYADAMGKTPIVMQDCPGFVVNRALTPYLIAFLRLVHDGADFAHVDKVMETFGWPMGPAYLIDVIGMDISHHVVEIVSAGFPERMQTSFASAIDILLREKRLGQKNGHGFYKYAKDAKGRPRKELDPETDRLLAEARPNGKIAIGEDEIVERMMLPLIFEAARCVEDGVVGSRGEADMSLILGLGLPRYLGGALKYADHLGVANVVASAAKWESLGAIYRPSEGFSAMAAAGDVFYPA
ncbi:fatty acid oxidation complex subunit alpha FadB [Methylocapsa aurea]|uniref:fatty acid oxidation complex subunit alpha FadB n=1 Tax=Methylocapsa aurea TaxID=663610 RepID=UPI000561D58B|nr:fatty acid oxidation complex subunit alpha FadB [Methylocapsa aurea]